MPLQSTGTSSSTSSSQNQEFQTEQQPRLLYATSNKQHADTPIEMAFAVNENGQEKIITVRNVHSADLFYMTEEGNQWQQQQQQQRSNVRSLRRTA